MGEGKNPNERRNAERMTIEREVHYRVLNKKDGDAEALGKTLNISSSGVLFTTEHMLPPGRRLELSISWPAQLDNKCALKLVARGRVVRFEGDRAALEIMQHEFRTKSVRPVG
jgi:c-di-GMP-binding flagellar brake protein YcgR